MECPLTAEDLKLPYKQLLAVVKQKKVKLKLTKEEIKRLPEPDVCWEGDEELDEALYKKVFDEALVSYTGEGEKKFRLLYNTVCRELVVKEFMSESNATFEEELQFVMDDVAAIPGFFDNDVELDENDSSMMPSSSDFEGILNETSDSDSELELNETPSNGVRNGPQRPEPVHQVSSVPQGPSVLPINPGLSRLNDIDALKEPYSRSLVEANPPISSKNGRTELKSVFDLPRTLFTAQKQRSPDEKLRGVYLDPKVRKAAVDKSPVQCDSYVVQLGQNISEWDSFFKLVFKADRLMDPINMLTGYLFERCVDNDSQNRLLVTYKCSYDRPVSDESGTFFDLDWCTPLNCAGKISVEVSLVNKRIEFKHWHKHHFCDNFEFQYGDMPKSDLRRALFFMDFTAFSGTSRSGFIERMQGTLEGETGRGLIGTLFDMELRTRYRRSSSVWISMLMTYVSSSISRHVPFLFYSPGYAGLAVVFREVIARLNATSSLYTLTITIKRGIGAQQCDMVIVSATVDRIPIPVGYMFFDKIEMVLRDLKVGGIAVRNENKPIDQCNIANEINSVANAKFPNDPKTALLTSFLMLFKGTDRKKFVHRNANGGYNNNPPSSSELSAKLKVCKLATGVRTRMGLTIEGEKAFSELKSVTSIVCDSDVSVTRALRFVFHGIPYRFSLGDMVEKIKSDIVPWNPLHYKLRPKPPSPFSYGRTISFYDWLQKTEFPPFFVDVFPWLFDKKPHSRKKCPYRKCKSPLKPVYKCWQCNPKFYQKWNNGRLSRRDIYHTRKTPFSELANLLQMHATANPAIPYRFHYLGDLVKVSKDCLFYNSKTLHRGILCEILEFCLNIRALDLFQYLWDNVYCGKRFVKWSSCFRDTFDDFATGPEPIKTVSFFDFTPKYKRADYDDEEDRLCNLDHLVGVDEKVYSKKRLTLLNVMWADRKYDDHEEAFGNLRSDWILKRWKLMLKLFKERKKHKSSSSLPYYRRDCVKFGTDARMFVCGCSHYAENNVHLCKHIVRAMEPYSFCKKERRYTRANLRARNQLPFYAALDSKVKGLKNDNIWLGLTFRKDYLKFWKEEGVYITSSKHC